MLALFGILLFPLYLAAQTWVVVSDRTRAALIEGFTKAARTEAFDVVMWPVSSMDPPPGLIFDFTNSELYGFQLLQASQTHRILLFSRTATAHLASDWQFFLHPSQNSDIEALSALMNVIDWAKYHLVGTIESAAVTQAFFQTASTHKESYSVMPPSSFDLYCRKAIKSSGNWKTVLFSQAASAFVPALEAAKIYKAGCGLVVSRFGAWGEFEAGTIAVVDTGLEGATSETDYEVKAINTVLNTFDKDIVLVEDLLQACLAAFPTRVVFTSYSILNFLHATDFQVSGTIVGQNADLFTPLVFPGGVSEVPTTAPLIPLSATTIPFSPDGSISVVGYQLGLGVHSMVALVNGDSDLVPNFELSLYETDCGNDFFVYDYFLACLLRHKDNLGTAYIQIADDTVVSGTVDILRTLSVEVPLIGSYIHNSTLLDKQQTPELIVPMQPMLYIQSIMPTILTVFNWKKCVVLFDADIDETGYHAFMDPAAILDIEVLNDYSAQFVNYAYAKEEFEAVNPGLAEILLRTQARVFVLFLTPPVDLLLGAVLYDLGLRRGDVVMITRYLPSYTFPLLTDSDIVAVNELFAGGLTLTVGEFIGDYGQALKNTISVMIAPAYPQFTCFGAEPVSLVAHAFDMMLQLGKDYEDPGLLNEYIRLQRFVGCTGKVSIDSSSNSKSDLTYQLYNMKATADSFLEEQIGYYSIGITVPLVIAQDIHWPDGATEVPTELRVEPACGFDEEDVVDNNESRERTAILVSSLGLVIAVVTLLVVGLRLRDTWPMLEGRREIMFEDGLTMALVGGEALLIVVLGPEVAGLSYSANYFAQVISLDFTRLLTLSGDNFWMFIHVLLGAGGGWMLCFWAEVLRLPRYLPDTIRGAVYWCGMKVAPVVSQIGLGVVLVFVLRLFHCAEGTGEMLQDSFLEGDCLTNCWTGPHLPYVGVMCGFIILFGVTGALARPLTDIHQDFVSVKLNPVLYVAKANGVILLVLLNDQMKDEFPIAFAYSYLVVCLGLAVVANLARPSNYARLNMWQRIASFLVCANAAISCVWVHTGEVALVYSMVLRLSVIAVGCVVGIIVQHKRYPSLLYRVPGRPIEGLFRFAFGKSDNLSSSLGRLDRPATLYSRPNPEYNDAAQRDAPNDSLSQQP